MSLLPPVLDAAPSQRAAPAAWASLLRWTARIAVGLSVAAATLLLLAWLALHWFILPHIQQWRAPIEARASDVLGATVTIAAIEMRTSRWVPDIELRGVALRDATGRVALELPRVIASLSARSLLALDLRFRQLLIDGASLEARRDPSGRIFVAGIDFGGAGGNDEDIDAADWFFAQREFVIRGGSLRWIDEQRDGIPLTLGDVQLIVRNGLRQHAIRLDATPPPEWGSRFTLQGQFTHSLLHGRGQWRHWSGTAHADLPDADVAALRRHVTLPFELSKGNGAVRAWFDVESGEPRRATVDLALREVALRLSPKVEPLGFELVHGRFVGQRDENGIAFGLQRFGFTTRDGVRWPAGDLALSLRQREGRPASGGQFSAQRLDIGVMRQIAAGLPIGGALHKLLDDVDPRGTVTDIGAQWDGALDAPERYQVHGQLSGLSLNPRASPQLKELGRPGVRNANVRLRATEAGGDAHIVMAAGAVNLPGALADPLVPFDAFEANLLWSIEPKGAPAGAPHVRVQLRDARFRNLDAQGQLSASWSTGDPADVARGGRFPGRLELDAKVAQGRAARIARYLPLGLPEATRRYVEGAVRGGTLEDVSFRVKGHLRDFPFHNARTGKDGEFRIAGKVENATFAFIPDEPVWPPLTRLSGEVVIDRSRLEFRNAKAELGGVSWSQGQGAIPNLDDRPVLGLQAQAAGPVPEMLRLVNATPVGGWIGGSLARATATGPGDLRMALSIPLGDGGPTTVSGSLGLGGNDIRFTPETPRLLGARGRVDFTERGFTVPQATARVLGGDASLSGGTQGDGTIRLSGQGVATAEGLRQAGELGLVARLASALSGQAEYRANLAFVNGHPQLLVTSPLVGMAADLPVPLGKPATTPVEFRYQSETSEPAGGLERETLRVDLANLLHVQYVTERQGQATRVLRGGIGVLVPAPTPASGVAAHIDLQRLDADRWEATLDKLFAAPAPPTSVSTPATPSAALAEETGSADTGSDYLPDTVALRTQELLTGGRRVTRVVVGASEAGAGLWRANVTADQLEGYIEYRPSRRRSGASGSGPGRLLARLSRLSLPRSEVGNVETLLDPQPTGVPGLDIVIDDFELAGKRLGRVEIEAANRLVREPGREPQREWRLSKLNVSTPEGRLAATGSWATPTRSAPNAGTRRRTSMAFTLHVANSGALLERLGVGQTIRGGKGELAGEVSWEGSPLSLDYPSLSGQIHVAIDAGQFLKAEPGAARLLSVLSLQSLPRRLALDFRDVFEEGFTFDNIAGDVTITQGVARTNNLRMRGPAAVVLMEGAADIHRETQDLRVVVVPEINAGTASLAFAIINPAVGIGTFLAQYFLRKPLIEAGTREFRVSGSWADPKMERVARARGEAAVSAEAPARPASSPN